MGEKCIISLYYKFIVLVNDLHFGFKKTRDTFSLQVNFKDEFYSNNWYRGRVGTLSWGPMLRGVQINATFQKEK